MKKLALIFVLLVPTLVAAQGCPAGFSCMVSSAQDIIVPVNMAQQGIAFNSQNLIAVGSTGAVTWAVTSGALTQNGLTITQGATSSITGSSPTAGASTWIVKWTDSLNVTFSETISIIVGAISTVTVSPPTVNLNQGTTTNFTAQATFANNTSADVTAAATWSLGTGGGNPGCTGSTISGSGTPRTFTAGSTGGACTVTATFQSTNGSATVTVSATSGNPTIQNTDPLPNGQINQPYSIATSGINGSQGIGQGVRITATGGTAPYTCSITAGSLPTGLSLANVGGDTNCLIQGTPTSAGAGSSITFHVVDSAAASNNFVAASGITIESLSSLAVNLVPSTITANTSAMATVTGTYSGGSTANVPIATAGQRQCVKTGISTANPAASQTSLQVSTSCSTTTGWMAVGLAESWNTSACTSTTMGITSPNETFNAATTSVGQAGAPPPYVNCAQMFYAFNITGNAADQPTCTFSTASGFLCIVVYYSGVPTTDPRDQHPAPTKSTAGTATSCVPSSITTSQANEIIVGFCVTNGATTLTAPAGYSAVVSADSALDFDAIVTAIQTGITPSASFSPADNYDALIASFNANALPAGAASLSSSDTTVATVTGSVIQGQSVLTQKTATITATVGVTTGNATITVNPNTTDTSIIIVPNPTASASITPPNNTVPLKAIGNVTSQLYNANWGITPTSPNGTISSTTGSQVTATCLNATGTYTINATVSGLTSGSTTLTCVAANVINLTDCNPATLQSQWNTMSSGVYILNMPSGTCTWTNPSGSNTALNLTIPTNVTSVTIQGNTVVNCTGTAGTSSWNCAATDNTIIVDSFTANGLNLINFNTGSSTSTVLRITGITFQGGNIGSTSTHPNGFMQFSGASQNLRIDHLHINTKTYNRLDIGGGMTFYGYTYGVADHIRADTAWQENTFRSYNQSGGGGYGDLPWSQPTALGTSNFLFIENNYNSGGFLNDCDAGGRQVARYNTVISYANDTTGDSGAIQSHTTSQGVARERGCRVIERYHNYFINPTPSVGHQFSAGDGNVGGSVYFGSTVTTGYDNDLVLEENSRVISGNNCGVGAGVSGGCAAPPNGFGYCGNGSSGVLSVWDGNSNSAGYPCLDQTGRGQSDLLNGAVFPSTRNNTTSCVPTSPPGCSVWPHSLREPYYIWNETVTSGSVCHAITLNGAVRQSDRDYYCQVSNTANSGCPGACTPFNGTTGTGFGVLAQRPTTCTAGPGGQFDTSPTGSYGVGYFATDTNTLYVCTSTNTWTSIYTPFTYPHPLDTGP